MMMFLFILAIVASWVLGLSDGDCTAAVMLSLCGALALMDKLKEKKKAKENRAYYREVSENE